MEISLLINLFSVIKRHLSSCNISFSWRNKKAVGFVCCWWLFWGVSSFETSELFPPSHTVFYIVAIFCLGLWLGSIGYELIAKKRDANHRYTEEFIPSYMLILKFLLFPVILGMLWIIYKAFLLVATAHLELSLVRSSFYNYTYDWFPNKVLWSGYVLLSGITIHFLIVSFVPLLLKKKWLPTIGFIFLLAGETIAKGSRGLLYSMVVICFFYSVIFLQKFKKISVRKIFVLSCAVFIFFGGGLYLVSKARGDSVIKRGIEYHLVGMSLLSNIVEARQGYEEDTPYWGRYCSGGIDYFLSMLIRVFFDKEYFTPSMDSMQIQAVPVPSGRAPDSNIHFLNNNTFYTMLSSPYRDFGDMGVLLFGLIAGLLLTYYEAQYESYHSTFALIWLTFYTYNFIMGLFGVTLETPGFWGVLLLLLYVEKSNQRDSLQKVV